LPLTYVIAKRGERENKHQQQASREVRERKKLSEFREIEGKKKMMNGDSRGALEAQYIRRHHRHEPRENQCTSALVKHIKAPVHLVS